jgi:hypothetical protein
MSDAPDDLKTRTIEALVDERIAKRIADGEVFSRPESIRALVRNGICQQAREYPGWLRQQAVRLKLVERKGPSIPIARCAYCNAGIAPARYVTRGTVVRTARASTPARRL